MMAKQPNSPITRAATTFTTLHPFSKLFTSFIHSSPKSKKMENDFHVFFFFFMLVGVCNYDVDISIAMASGTIRKKFMKMTKYYITIKNCHRNFTSNVVVIPHLNDHYCGIRMVIGHSKLFYLLI